MMQDQEFYEHFGSGHLVCQLLITRRNGILVAVMSKNSYVTSFMNDADTTMMRQYLYCSGRKEMMHFCNIVV